MGEDRRRIGGGLEDDWRMIGGGLEDDWRRIGGGSEEDWRRIGGGVEEDWRRIGGGLEDWRRIGEVVEEHFHRLRWLSIDFHGCHRFAKNQVLCFLGLTSLYRRFKLSHASQKIDLEEIYRLLSKNHNFMPCGSVFENLWNPY